MEQNAEQSVADQAVSADQPTQQPADPVVESQPVPGGKVFVDEASPVAEPVNLEAPPPAAVPANDPPPPLRAARVDDVPAGEPASTTAPRPREITTHQVNEANRQIGILVRDEPGPGGAPHRYELWGFDITRNPSQQDWMEPTEQLTLLFQNGPIGEVGVNGITHEALLAIVVDRTECWQNGPFACPENERALAHLRAALDFMRMRTHRRTLAGTEGTLSGS